MTFSPAKAGGGYGPLTLSQFYRRKYASFWAYFTVEELDGPSPPDPVADELIIGDYVSSISKRHIPFVEERRRKPSNKRVRKTSRSSLRKRKSVRKRSYSPRPKSASPTRVSCVDFDFDAVLGPKSTGPAVLLAYEAALSLALREAMDGHLDLSNPLPLSEVTAEPEPVPSFVKRWFYVRGQGYCWFKLGMHLTHEGVADLELRSDFTTKDLRDLIEKHIEYWDDNGGFEDEGYEDCYVRMEQEEDGDMHIASFSIGCTSRREGEDFTLRSLLEFLIDLEVDPDDSGVDLSNERPIYVGSGGSEVDTAHAQVAAAALDFAVRHDKLEFFRYAMENSVSWVRSHFGDLPSAPEWAYGHVQASGLPPLPIPDLPIDQPPWAPGPVIPPPGQFPMPAPITMPGPVIPPGAEIPPVEQMPIIVDRWIDAFLEWLKRFPAFDDALWEALGEQAKFLVHYLSVFGTDLLSVFTHMYHNAVFAIDVASPLFRLLNLVVADLKEKHGADVVYQQNRSFMLMGNLVSELAGIDYELLPARNTTQDVSLAPPPRLMDMMREASDVDDSTNCARAVGIEVQRLYAANARALVALPKVTVQNHVSQIQLDALQAALPMVNVIRGATGNPHSVLQCVRSAFRRRVLDASAALALPLSLIGASAPEIAFFSQHTAVVHNCGPILSGRDEYRINYASGPLGQIHSLFSDDHRFEVCPHEDAVYKRSVAVSMFSAHDIRPADFVNAMVRKQQRTAYVALHLPVPMLDDRIKEYTCTLTGLRFVRMGDRINVWHTDDGSAGYGHDAETLLDWIRPWDVSPGVNITIETMAQFGSAHLMVVQIGLGRQETIPITRHTQISDFYIMPSLLDDTLCTGERKFIAVPAKRFEQLVMYTRTAPEVDRTQENISNKLRGQMAMIKVGKHTVEARWDLDVSDATSVVAHVLLAEWITRKSVDRTYVKAKEYYAAAFRRTSKNFGVRYFQYLVDNFTFALSQKKTYLDRTVVDAFQDWFFAANMAAPKLYNPYERANRYYVLVKPANDERRVVISVTRKMLSYLSRPPVLVALAAKAIITPMIRRVQRCLFCLLESKEKVCSDCLAERPDVLCGVCWSRLDEDGDCRTCISSRMLDEENRPSPSKGKARVLPSISEADTSSTILMVPPRVEDVIPDDLPWGEPVRRKKRAPVLATSMPPPEINFFAQTEEEVPVQPEPSIRQPVIETAIAITARPITRDAPAIASRAPSVTQTIDTSDSVSLVSHDDHLSIFETQPPDDSLPEVHFPVVGNDLQPGTSVVDCAWQNIRRKMNFLADLGDNALFDHDDDRTFHERYRGEALEPFSREWLEVDCPSNGAARLVIDWLNKPGKMGDAHGAKTKAQGVLKSVLDLGHSESLLSEYVSFGEDKAKREKFRQAHPHATKAIELAHAAYNRRINAAAVPYDMLLIQGPPMCAKSSLLRAAMENSDKMFDVVVPSRKLKEEWTSKLNPKRAMVFTRHGCILNRYPDVLIIDEIFNFNAKELNVIIRSRARSAGVLKVVVLGDPYQRTGRSDALKENDFVFIDVPRLNMRTSLGLPVDALYMYCMANNIPQGRFDTTGRETASIFFCPEKIIPKNMDLAMTPDLNYDTRTKSQRKNSGDMPSVPQCQGVRAKFAVLFADVSLKQAINLNTNAGAMSVAYTRHNGSMWVIAAPSKFSALIPAGVRLRKFRIEDTLVVEGSVNALRDRLIVPFCHDLMLSEPKLKDSRARGYVPAIIPGLTSVPLSVNRYDETGDRHDPAPAVPILPGEIQGHISSRVEDLAPLTERLDVDVPDGGIRKLRRPELPEDKPLRAGFRDITGLVAIQSASDEYRALRDACDRQFSQSQPVKDFKKAFAEGDKLYQRFVEVFYAERQRIMVDVDATAHWLNGRLQAFIDRLASSDPLYASADTVTAEVFRKSQGKVKPIPDYAASDPYGQTIIASPPAFTARFAPLCQLIQVNLPGMLRNDMICDVGYSDDDLSRLIRERSLQHIFDDKHTQFDLSKQDSTHSLPTLWCFVRIAADAGCDVDVLMEYLHFCTMYYARSQFSDAFAGVISYNLGSGDPFTLIRNCIMMLTCIANTFEHAGSAQGVQKGDDWTGWLQSFRLHKNANLASMRRINWKPVLTSIVGTTPRAPSAPYHAGRFWNGHRLLADPVRVFYKHLARLVDSNVSVKELYVSFRSRAVDYSLEETDFLVNAVSTVYDDMPAPDIMLIISIVAAMNDYRFFSALISGLSSFEGKVIDTNDCIFDCVTYMKPDLPLWRREQYRNRALRSIKMMLRQDDIPFLVVERMPLQIQPCIIYLTPSHAVVLKGPL